MPSRDDDPLELSRLSLPRALYETTMRSQIDVQAAQIAFNAVFSLGPILALSTTLLGVLPSATFVARFREVIVPYAPEAVRPFVEGQFHVMNRSPNVLLVILSLLGLLWTISASTGAISTALGHVGWPLAPGWARQRVRAAVLGIVAAVGLALSAVAASIGPRVLRILSEFTRIPLVGLTSVAWLRWPLAGLMFGLASALFVSFGTKARPRALAILCGGLTSGVISLGASFGLGVYFSLAPKLGGAYGAAGAVFAALLWLYLLAFGLLVGSIVAFVLHARGPHFAPIITGAPHVGTHEVGDVLSERGTRGRILRRRPTHRGRKHRGRARS